MSPIELFLYIVAGGLGMVVVLLVAALAGGFVHAWVKK
jgi:hypothetical protein